MIRLVTGRIGSGKSKVMDILREKGYQCINTDDVAKELISHDGFFKDVVNIFGKACLTDKGEIDKAYLWKEFMAKSEAFDRYDDYVTEKVICYIQSETMNSNVPVFVETALVQKHINALLTAVHIEDVLLVKTSTDIRITRLLNRGMTRERIDFMDSIQGFVKDAWVMHVLDVDNNGDESELARNVNHALEHCSFNENEREATFSHIYTELPTYAKANTHCYMYYNMRRCSKCPFPCPQADWHFKEERKKMPFFENSPMDLKEYFKVMDEANLFKHRVIMAVCELYGQQFASTNVNASWLQDYHGVLVGVHIHFNDGYNFQRRISTRVLELALDGKFDEARKLLGMNDE